MSTRFQALHLAPALGLVVAVSCAYGVAEGYVGYRYGALAGANSVPHDIPPTWIATDALPGLIALGALVVPLLLAWAVVRRFDLVSRLWAFHDDFVDGVLGDRAAEWWLSVRLGGVVTLAVLAALWFRSR